MKKSEGGAVLIEIFQPVCMQDSICSVGSWLSDDSQFIFSVKLMPNRGKTVAFQRSIAHPKA